MIKITEAFPPAVLVAFVVLVVLQILGLRIGLSEPLRLVAKRGRRQVRSQFPADEVNQRLDRGLDAGDAGFHIAADCGPGHAADRLRHQPVPNVDVTLEDVLFLFLELLDLLTLFEFLDLLAFLALFEFLAVLELLANLLGELLLLPEFLAFLELLLLDVFLALLGHLLG